MSRDDYATRGEVETAITLMGGGISEEHAGGGARRQLVASCGGHVRLTEAPEDTEKGVIWWRAVQQREGDAILDGRTRAPIQEIGGRAEDLSPVGGGMCAWISRVRMMLFNVRRTRSALPFCGGV